MFIGRMFGLKLNLIMLFKKRKWLVLALCMAGNAFAVTTTWTGLGDGVAWSDAANWDGGGVPNDNTLDVVIGSGTPQGQKY
jgi:hypothetical protein